jgi:hypothetical protein
VAYENGAHGPTAGVRLRLESSAANPIAASYRIEKIVPKIGHRVPLDGSGPTLHFSESNIRE